MSKLNLVSSNQYPTRKIAPECLEAIRAFLSARSAMYEAIEAIEDKFKMEISLDAGERHLFQIADFNFSDWPADKAVSLEEGNRFMQQFTGERPIDEITDEEIAELYGSADAMRLRLVPTL
jgi:hypothetical protein